MTNVIMGLVMFVLGLLGGVFMAVTSFNIVGTMLIDKSKDIDIYRIELDREITGKYTVFKNKYVANLESASETKYIIGGDNNG